MSNIFPFIFKEKKYYNLEKQTEDDLQTATEELRKEQDKLEKISKELIFSSSIDQDLDSLKNSLSYLEKSQKYIKENVEFFKRKKGSKRVLLGDAYSIAEIIVKKFWKI